MPTTAKSTQTPFERLVAKYREDHRNPVNNFLHVGVRLAALRGGGPPAAVPAALVAGPGAHRLCDHVRGPLPLRAEHAHDPQAPGARHS